MLSYLAILSLAVSLANAVVIPGLHTTEIIGEVQERAAPQPLKVDFVVSKTIGNQTVKEFKRKLRATQLGKRAAYPEPIVDEGDSAYLINIFLGDDEQESTVILDTGLSDLWVTTAEYTPGSSARYTGEPFQIGYGDGSSEAGEYLTDTFSFSANDDEPVLQNFQFALVEDSSTGGILGIGGKDTEAAYVPYNDLPYALQAAGITPKASYSLYLGPDLGLGSVIFGGIDTDKYSGTLETYPSAGNGLTVDVSSIAVNGQTFTSGDAYLLDSGTTLGFVSKDVQDVLDSLFPHTLEQDGSITYRKLTSCNQPTDKFVTFDFGKNVIKFSYADLVAHQEDGCYLGFTYNGSDRILGDVFLRKAYVYYDLTDNTIALAQALYSSSSNIISA